MTYIYIWEYLVQSEYRDDFILEYGENGSWSIFFGRAEGYIKTELICDISNQLRFITVDYWESKQHCDNYKSQHLNEFKEIDEKYETYTTSEIHLGNFDLI